MPADDYAEFLARKAQYDGRSGFAPLWMPDGAFDYQVAAIEWACRQGRCALFEDTGMGKTVQELAWGENVVRHANGRVLLLTPLAVGAQVEREAERFGIDARRADKVDARKGIYITNYQRLHHFDPADFVGVIGDESSCLKAFDGTTRKVATEFMRTLPYRLLATATPAPNDYPELGTASEALGQLGYVDMLNRFFVNQNRTSDVRGHWKGHAAPHAYEQKQWRFKGHSEKPFWRWLCSWARAARKPSDLGPFDDVRFVLPPVLQREHMVKTAKPREGFLFPVPAVGLAEQREERRHSIRERCERVAELCGAHDRSLVWCALNDEGDLLEELCPGAVQVAGSDSDEVKEERLLAFADGEIRTLVTKPAIGALGLNLQRCAHQTWFASHSFQDFYQGVRRSHRYGQTRQVVVDIVATEGEGRVLARLRYKEEQAALMFDRLIEHVHDAMSVDRVRYEPVSVKVPPWM
jgi:hypothetical protein